MYNPIFTAIKDVKNVSKKKPDPGKVCNYSSLPNRRVARNKRGGGKDEPFLISVVPVISVAVGKMSHS